MSEFSFGNLVRNRHREVCEELLNDELHMKDLNENWFCLLTPKDILFDLTKSKVPATPAITELSKKVPILFFAHPEDHGFGFAVFEGGNVVGSYYIDFQAFEKTPDVVDIELFKKFDCTDEQLRKLDSLLNSDDWIEDLFEFPGKFMRILGIQDMSFVSWDYSMLL